MLLLSLNVIFHYHQTSTILVCKLTTKDKLHFVQYLCSIWLRLACSAQGLSGVISWADDSPT